MREGMLWYDNTTKTDIKEKINGAVDFFKEKYGQMPKVCYVHPQSIDSEFILDKTVKVLSNDKIIKNHIWLEFPED